METIQLNLIALANSESNEGKYVVVLEEEGGNRRLPIIIGAFEAQAIAVPLEKVETPRPLTHDLFKNTLVEAGITLHKVVISDLVEGVFYAKLSGKKADGSPLEIDARPSDAIAIAIRMGCPIYASRGLMDEVGIMADRGKKHRASLDDYSIKELENMLEEALEKEDYQQATKIRDAINRKK
jgi:bifunctional DNase/RNase